MTTEKTTALAVVSEAAPLAVRLDRAAFEPRDLNEALHLSEVLVASRLLPKTLATPEAAFAVIATGRELGLSAMQSVRLIHVIEGKASLSADLMVALVKTSPVCEFFRLVESTPAGATYETQRRGEPPTKMSFTADEAKTAGLIGKDNWRKYPAAMLRARASAALARAVYPDLVGGLYDPDEIAPEPRDVTPARTPVADRVVEARPVAPPESAPVTTAPVAAPSMPAEPPAAPAPAEPMPARAPPANPEFARLAGLLSSAVSRVERLDAGAAVRASLAAGKITDAEREELRRAYATSVNGAK